MCLGREVAEVKWQPLHFCQGQTLAIFLIGVRVNCDHCQALSTKLPFSLSFHAVFFGLMSLCTTHRLEVGVTFPP